MSENALAHKVELGRYSTCLNLKFTHHNVSGPGEFYTPDKVVHNYTYVFDRGKTFSKLPTVEHITTVIILERL